MEPAAVVYWHPTVSSITILLWSEQKCNISLQGKKKSSVQWAEVLVWWKFTFTTWIICSVTINPMCDCHFCLSVLWVCLHITCLNVIPKSHLFKCGFLFSGECSPRTDCAWESRQSAQSERPKPRLLCCIPPSRRVSLCYCLLNVTPHHKVIMGCIPHQLHKRSRGNSKKLSQVPGLHIVQCCLLIH